MAAAILMALVAATLTFVPTTPTAADTRADATTAAPQTGPDTRSVERLYLAYFLRDPDPAGLTYWERRHAAGTPLSAISSAFARSAEFRATYGAVADTEFVRLVYRNVLGREPDGSGLTHWATQLTSGRSRGTVMLGFSDSAEYKATTGVVGAPLVEASPGAGRTPASPTAA
ncbi:MAG TPA: DUF4214 domain-containing protein, partial [Acidimicrobiales bacterium]|nr:DUF4214 domain-containing protein [Acidimicrobiales bacterium]